MISSWKHPWPNRRDNQVTRWSRLSLHQSSSMFINWVFSISKREKKEKLETDIKRIETYLFVILVFHNVKRVLRALHQRQHHVRRIKWLKRWRKNFYRVLHPWWQSGSLDFGMRRQLLGSPLFSILLPLESCQLELYKQSNHLGFHIWWCKQYKFNS